MTTDPYAVLGLAPGADLESVRHAFRRLSMELHPDRRPDDAAAARRYAEVTQAYKAIRDPPPPPIVAAGIDLIGRIQLPLWLHVRGGAPVVNLDFGRHGSRRVPVQVPAGAGVGWEQRFPKLGAAGEPPGDLVVRVDQVVGDPNWRVEGLDLHRTLAVDLADLIEGAAVTLDVLGVSQRLELRRGDLSSRRFPRAGLRRGGRVGDAVVDLEVRWPRPTPELLRVLRGG